MEPGQNSAVTITELEGALAQVDCIRAVRIVASDEGLIEEIHVLGLPGKAPKQLVRDIESTLMALYGIPIDRRKISIAQIGADEAPHAVEAAGPALAPVPDSVEEPATAEVEAPASEAHAAPTDHDSEHSHASRAHPMRRLADVLPIGTAYEGAPRIRIQGVEVDTDSLRTNVRVRLGSQDGDSRGEATGPAGTKAVLRLVAEATLRAVEQLEASACCWAVEDCQVLSLGGRQIAVCSIVTVTSDGEQALAGSAVVRHTAESATARATLDALNRRLGL